MHGPDRQVQRRIRTSRIPLVDGVAVAVPENSARTMWMPRRSGGRAAVARPVAVIATGVPTGLPFTVSCAVPPATAPADVTRSAAVIVCDESPISRERVSVVAEVAFTVSGAEIAVAGGSLLPTP